MVVVMQPGREGVQALLLAGYLYAHWSIRRLGPRRQALLHLAQSIVQVPTLT